MKKDSKQMDTSGVDDPIEPPLHESLRIRLQPKDVETEIFDAKSERYNEVKSQMISVFDVCKPSNFNYEDDIINEKETGYHLDKKVVLS